SITTRSTPIPTSRLAKSVSDFVIVEWVDTSCNRRLPPAGAGTRTQHTNSALPMSKAATLAMICSSSCDSANIPVISSRTLTPVHLGCGRLRISHGDNDSDPRARTSGNSEEPKSGIRRPARYTASQNHSVSRRRQATTAQFSSPKGDRQVRMARTLNLHWGLLQPHILWLYRPGPDSRRQPTLTCE